MLQKAVEPPTSMTQSGSSAKAGAHKTHNRAAANAQTRPRPRPVHNPAMVACRTLHKGAAASCAAKVPNAKQNSIYSSGKSTPAVSVPWMWKLTTAIHHRCLQRARLERAASW